MFNIEEYSLQSCAFCYSAQSLIKRKLKQYQPDQQKSRQEQHVQQQSLQQQQQAQKRTSNQQKGHLVAAKFGKCSISLVGEEWKQVCNSCPEERHDDLLKIM